MQWPSSEGTWFAVPLRTGGFATGLVARATSKGKVLLGYFFGPRRAAPPKLKELQGLKAADASKVCRFGDLSLIQEKWPILGQADPWRREEWPMPVFVRREPFTDAIFKVYHSDADPGRRVKEERVFSEGEVAGLGRDSMSGAGAVEVHLTKLLG